VYPNSAPSCDSSPLASDPLPPIARLRATLDPADFSVVADHVGASETGVYWLRMDDEWRITAASGSFQDEVLRVHEPFTCDFLETLAPGLADQVAKWARFEELHQRGIELVHPIRTGSRVVCYTFRRADAGWLAFGRDRSDQLELVAQMAALIEDLDVEMQRERALATRLRSLLANDHLTGLANRRHLEEVLRTIWDGFVASKSSFSVIAIDVDGFKKFNDNYGHDVGDQVLRRVADAITSSVRDGDIASRPGGDEFVVVARASSLEQAERIGERIRTRVQTSPMPCGGGRVSVSVGVASTSPIAPEGPDELLRWADAALLCAKGAGRNRVEVYEAPAR